eukprot:1972814-Rhodomonas_salina.1
MFGSSGRCSSLVDEYARRARAERRGMWLIRNVVVCSKAGRGIQLECSRKMIWISIGADSSRLLAVG